MHPFDQRLSLRRSDLVSEGSRLEMVVEDDGRGVDPAIPRSGLGLIGLRERVEALGGRFDIDGEPGTGTRVFAAIPLADDGTKANV